MQCVSVTFTFLRALVPHHAHSTCSDSSRPPGFSGHLWGSNADMLGPPKQLVPQVSAGGYHGCSLSRRRRAVDGLASWELCVAERPHRTPQPLAAWSAVVCSVTEARVVHMCPGSCLISNYYLGACRFQPGNLMTHHSRRSGSLSGDFGVYRFDAVRARYERHNGT